MTEADWENIKGHSQGMMNVLQARKLPRTKAGRRKLRLFACACCRAAWDSLPDPRLRDAIETAERFADGLASMDQLAAARAAVSWMRADSAVPAGTPVHVRVAIDMAVATTDAQAFSAAFSMTATVLPLAGRQGSQRDGEAALCRLIRCVFGNPFRPVRPLSASVLRWQDGLVVRMANDIHEGRSLPSGELDPDRLAVLADALEDAGCTEGGVLNHLREPGPHVRGCFAIDLVLPRD